MILLPLLASALVLGGDPYAGFQARYHPFANNSLIRIPLSELRRRGFDATSPLHAKRKEIVAVLRRAKDVGKAGKDEGERRNMRLFLRLGREEWAVDKDGTVLAHDRILEFSYADFTELRDLILIQMPFMEEERAEIGHRLRKARGEE